MNNKATKAIIEYANSAPIERSNQFMAGVVKAMRLIAKHDKGFKKALENEGYTF